MSSGRVGVQQPTRNARTNRWLAGCLDSDGDGLDCSVNALEWLRRPSHPGCRSGTKTRGDYAELHHVLQLRRSSTRTRKTFRRRTKSRISEMSDALEAVKGVREPCCVRLDDCGPARTKTSQDHDSSQTLPRGQRDMHIRTQRQIPADLSVTENPQTRGLWR